jgi:hypothetical protein
MFIRTLCNGMAGKKQSSPQFPLDNYFSRHNSSILLWPTLLLFDVESCVHRTGVSKVTPLAFTDYPISHSLLAVLGWSIVFGVIYFLITKE